MKESKQHVQQPKTFDQADLDQRCEKVKAQYLNGHYKRYGEYTHGQWVFPATVPVSAYSVEELVDKLIDFAIAGQPRFKNEKIVCSVGFNSALVYKPQADLDADLAILFEEEKASYEQEIEAFNQQQVELLAAQLYEQEQKKEQKKKEDLEAKQKAKALAEAQEYFQSLQNNKE